MAIWDDLKKRIVIELEFCSDVLSVRLRRDRIVVVLEGVIKVSIILNESQIVPTADLCAQVFTFTSSPTQLHIFDTSLNPRGLCSLSPSCDNSVLAMPGTKVIVTDIITLIKTLIVVITLLMCSDSCYDDVMSVTSVSSGWAAAAGWPPVCRLPAPGDPRPWLRPLHHPAQCPGQCLPCSCLCHDHPDYLQGTKVATASTKGTLIRVFDTVSGAIITELRRWGVLLSFWGNL
mgnify:CR=1 FL=1